MTYAQISTGYKGGGINPRPFTANQVVPFGPETLTAYEVGMKSDLFGRTVRVNASAFYNDYKDIQLTLSACPGTPCAQPANAGDADVTGVELETEIHPIDRLQIDASGSFINFKYTRIAQNVSGVAIDMVAPYTPKLKGSAGIQYELPIGDKGSITPRFDISYQDEIYTNAWNRATNRIGGYSVMNARLTWRAPDEKWSSALEVTNLSDKVYYNSLLDLSAAGGSVTGQIGMPRTWAVTLRRNFD
jgi:iron complex outermembrane receptor protein